MQINQSPTKNQVELEDTPSGLNSTTPILFYFCFKAERHRFLQSIQRHQPNHKVDCGIDQKIPKGPSRFRKTVTNDLCFHLGVTCMKPQMWTRDVDSPRPNTRLFDQHGLCWKWLDVTFDCGSTTQLGKPSIENFIFEFGKDQRQVGVPYSVTIFTKPFPLPPWSHTHTHLLSPLQRTPFQLGI